MLAMVGACLDSVRGQLNGRIAYSEEEAARLIGLEAHALRDERRRGRVRAYQVIGGRIRYTREDLVAYLIRQPWSEETRRRSGWQRGVARQKSKDAALEPAD